MNSPDWPPPSLHSRAPPRSSSIASNVHDQQAVPAQRRQQQSIVIPQSHANAFPTPFHYGTLSAKERTAIGNLQGIPTPTILAWVESVRSSTRGEQSYDPRQLSSQHYQAVSALIGCSNELIETLLNIARSPSASDSLQKFNENDNLNSPRVATHPFAQSSSSFSRPLNHITPGIPWDQDSYPFSGHTLVGTQSSSAATLDEHVRWCFRCDDPKPIKTLDGLKRHMREHYTTYCCDPRDFVSNTEDGPRCTFCGLSNPDSRHLDLHSDPGCSGKRYTRKENLIKHLKKRHNIRHGSASADQFEYTVNQRYFACGFCVLHCGSLNELVNHVDAVHYRSSEHIRDWDDNKVICGLLSQSVFRKYWQDLQAANPDLRNVSLTWDRTHTQQLRYRLEMCREPVNVLFRAAISESSYGMSQQGQIKSMPFIGFRDMGMDTSQSFVSYSPRITAPILQSQNLADDRDRLNDSDLDTDSEHRSSPKIASEMYGSTVSATYHHSCLREQAWSLPNSGESFVQHQHPAFISSIISASDTSQALEGQTQSLYSSRPDEYLPGISPIDPRSGNLIETDRYPTRPHTDFFIPTQPTQSESSSLSRTRETLPLDFLNSSYNPESYPIVATEYSPPQTRFRRGMGMDFDSNNQQRFTQSQNQSQRR